MVRKGVAMANITLQRLLNILCEEAIKEKIVNSALSTSSSRVINNLTISDYACLMIVPSGGHIWKENTMQFSLDIMYLDRLLDDSSNELNVQSTAIEELKHYINKLKELDFVVNINDEVEIQNFVETEAKSDRCAGAVARINLEVQNYSICYEE